MSNDCFDLQHGFREAPPEWGALHDLSLSSMHQISPYIGKLKPRIARDLVTSYTDPGDLIVDPFCGSGSIPLEANIAGRRVFASDSNPYAYTLTRAKLHPPRSLTEARTALDDVSRASRRRSAIRVSSIPNWVGQFFHPKTLVEAIQFVDECLEQEEFFLLACLLGILHHQRPGFLSYPSSHLVPYLRDKKFPPSIYPEMYEYRDFLPRMEAKLDRAYKSVILPQSRKLRKTILHSDIRTVNLPARFDAIITSPPYMNALDYLRDNRLRLWFIERTTLNYCSEPTDRKAGLQAMVMELVRMATSNLRSGGKVVLVIGETVVRKRQLSHPSSAYISALEATGKFSLVDAVRDSIPDIRRSRRYYTGTKAEHILVFKKR